MTTSAMRSKARGISSPIPTPQRPQAHVLGRVALADHVDVSAAIFVGAADAIAGPRAAVVAMKVAVEKVVAVVQAGQPRVAAAAAAEMAIPLNSRCSANR